MTNWNFKYMSNFTGALYHSLPEAIIDTISDMIHCKACRTFKAFDFSHYQE